MILMKPYTMRSVPDLPLIKSLVSPQRIKEECEDFVCTSSMDEDVDAPLDLRVNCGRVSPARDSGTESDDTEDKIILQDGAEPFKKSLIKRCKLPMTNIAVFYLIANTISSRLLTMQQDATTRTFPLSFRILRTHFI